MYNDPVRSVRQSICFVGLFIVAFATILLFGNIYFCCNQLRSVNSSVRQSICFVGLFIVAFATILLFS